MTFQSKLRPASFRGVSFDVTKTTLKVGRRVQVFEYPQRDIPFVEDLGRSAREVTVSAVVAGDDYISRMKKIISVCEKEGSGRYVDPWLGAMTVTPKALSAPEFQSIHVAKITITFVESGEYRFPNSLLNTGSLCETAAEKLKESALGVFFKEFNLEGVTDFVKKNVSENVASLFEDDNLKLISEALGMADGLADLASDALTLVEGGATTIGGRIMDTLGLAGVGSTVVAWSSIAKRASRLVKGETFNTSSVQAAGLSRTTVSKTETAVAAVRTLVRGVELANAVTAAAGVGSETDRVNADSSAEAVSYDDMISTRNEILDALDSEMLKTESDAVYQALEEARAAVYQDITVRAENRARCVDYTPPDVMPALVLAYEYYGDATREAEIIERNRIAHGSFVPVKPLKLLNE